MTACLTVYWKLLQRLFDFSYIIILRYWTFWALTSCCVCSFFQRLCYYVKKLPALYSTTLLRHAIQITCIRGVSLSIFMAA